jgi:hypothetical protein
MASGIYNHFKAELFNGLHDLDGGHTIKIALMGSGHSFTATTNHWANVSSNDIGTKVVYTANGVTLDNPTVTQAATTKWDADDEAIGPGETLTAYHIVLYDDTHADDGLICSFDLGGAQTCTNGTFTIQWHTDGILTLA